MTDKVVIEDLDDLLTEIYQMIGKSFFSYLFNGLAVEILDGNAPVGTKMGRRKRV